MRSLASGSTTRSLARSAARAPWAGSMVFCALAVAAAFAFAACDTPPVAGPRGFAPGIAPGIAPWASLFIASACARRLPRAAPGRAGGQPVPRMVCAMIGLLSWSELAWLLANGALGTAGLIEVACAVAVYAAVALSELHSIARAAHDAWLDGP